MPGSFSKADRQIQALLPVAISLILNIRDLASTFFSPLIPSKNFLAANSHTKSSIYFRPIYFKPIFPNASPFLKNESSIPSSRRRKYLVFDHVIINLVTKTLQIYFFHSAMLSKTSPTYYNCQKLHFLFSRKFQNGIQTDGKYFLS